MLKPEVGKKYKTIDSEPVSLRYRNRPFVVFGIDREYVHIQFLDGRQERRNINTEVFHLRCHPLEWGPKKVINKMKFV